MSVGIRNTLLGIAAFISIILGLLIASLVIPRPMSSDEAEQIGWYHFDQPRAINDFVMVDHDGKEVGLSVFRGQWSLVFFGFTTCPDICPTTLSVLNESVKKLDSPPQVVMITVDPERDSPQKLRGYVPAFNPLFRGFTGSFDQTVSLAEQMNIAFGKIPGPEPGTYTMDHTASIVLIDPYGRYAGFIKAPHRPEHITKVLRSL